MPTQFFYKHIMHSFIFHCILKTWRDHTKYYCTQHQDDEQSPHTNEQEEWMQLCQLNQQFADTQQASNTSPRTDWTEFARSLSPHTLLEAATWIRTDEVHIHYTKP